MDGVPSDPQQKGYPTGDRFRLMTGTWTDLAEASRWVRTAVFVDEQGIDPDDEWDSWDAVSLHAVVFEHRLGSTERPVATGRLLPADSSAVARIGRMAVMARVRRMGLGTRVLEALIQAAKLKSVVAIELSAQRSAVPLYAANGFVAVGEPYLEVGIEHVSMRRSLDHRDPS